MDKINWQYFDQDDCLQFLDERYSVLYWINRIGDLYYLNHSSDLFDLTNYEIMNISEDLDYLKYLAESDYQKKIEYIV
jgi:hypothetical protein